MEKNDKKQEKNVDRYSVKEEGRKPQIVILDGYTENPGDLSWDGFRALGELTVYDRTPREDVEEIVKRIGNAEIVCTNKTPITEEILRRVPSVRYIGVLATGYNVVDVQAAARRGIPVTNIPDYGTMAVAQYTIAMLLELCNRIGHHDRVVHEGRWTSARDFCFWDYPLMELAGKTMGIIGYGRIGQETARLARAFGMKILACRRRPVRPAKEDDQCRYVSMDELLAESDVISLHCPLFPETEGLINRQTIARMKDGVILLNTARGPLINEKDLAEALDCGKVYGAAVDVVSTEPIQADNPLLQAKNCLITPHVAWASRESRQRLMDTAVANLQAFLDGKPVHVVNL